jgi:hypothetical protein
MAIAKVECAARERCGNVHTNPNIQSPARVSRNYLGASRASASCPKESFENPDSGHSNMRQRTFAINVGGKIGSSVCGAVPKLQKDIH